MNHTPPIVALDLFAGTGWGVACHRLGIEEYGVEIMDAAIATREANGMKTIYNDVWDGLTNPELSIDYDLLIASPPCQTFSMAGAGSGRKALDDVLGLIGERAFELPGDGLRRVASERGLDDRTALVLTPLVHIYRDRPSLVALEQVPAVLPVWEAYAEAMREWGYSVDFSILNAEQYGVPQTRRRAILVAKLDGEAKLPVPTHSRYYSRDPKRLDPGVLPWVSMAEALGWDRAGVLYTQNNRLANQSVRPLSQPAPTVTAGHDSGNRGFISEEDFTVANTTEVAALQSYPSVLRSNYGTGGDPAARGERGVDQPSATVTSKVGRNKWDGVAPVSTEEASALQSYPGGWGFTDRPAMTVVNGVGRGLGGGSGSQGQIKKAIAEGRFLPSVHAKSDAYAEATRITVPEAGVLQTYERPFVWCDTKTKQFLQIGNAVPPRLAQAVLSALIS